MEGSATVGGWENCCMVDEPLHIAALLLKQKKKKKERKKERKEKRR
jgi:hypothetical protein